VKVISDDLGDHRDTSVTELHHRFDLTLEPRPPLRIGKPLEGVLALIIATEDGKDGRLSGYALRSGSVKLPTSRKHHFATSISDRRPSGREQIG
jgi:hypothetical protein